MTSLIIQFGIAKLFVSAFLALAVLLAQRTIKRPQVTHTLWLLVLVIMLAPALVQFDVPGWAGIASYSNPVVTDAGMGATSSGAAIAAVNAGSPALNLAGTLGRFLPLIWIAGSLFVLILSVVRTFSFQRMLDGASTEAPGELVVVAGEIAKRMRLSVVPRVRVTAARISPLVWLKSFSPIVVLPKQLLSDLSDTQLRMLLAHEIAHIKRRDHLVRVVEWMSGVVFWWNPITWLARRNLRQAEELCCDAQVLTNLDAAPRGYAQVLVSVVDFLSVPPVVPAPALAMKAAGDTSTNHIERRIRMIISGRSLAALPRRGRVALTAIVAFILPIGFVGIGNSDSKQIPTANHVTQATPERQEQCGELIARTLAALQAGAIAAEDANLRIARCTLPEKVEMKQAVEEKLVAEEELQQKKVAKVPAKVEMKSGIKEKLLPEVEMKSGVKEKLLPEVEMKQKKVAARMTQADCEKLAVEILTAVSAGTISAEQGLEKLKALCGSAKSAE